MAHLLVFSTHALRRMLRHDVRSHEVRDVLQTGDRIEEYPDDEPYPSFLALGWPGGRPLHVVAPHDADGGATIVITTYLPDTAK